MLSTHLTQCTICWRPKRFLSYPNTPTSVYINSIPYILFPYPELSFNLIMSFCYSRWALLRNSVPRCIALFPVAACIKNMKCHHIPKGENTWTMNKLLRLSTMTVSRIREQWLASLTGLAPEIQELEDAMEETIAELLVIVQSFVPILEWYIISNAFSGFLCGNDSPARTGLYLLVCHYQRLLAYSQNRVILPPPKAKGSKTTV